MRGRVTLGGVAALLIILALGLLPGPAQAKKPPKPPPGPADPAMAYMDGEDLMVMDDDGSNQTLVMAETGIMGWAAWSPNGEKLVFNCDAEGHGVYTINLDGSGLKKLVSTPGPDVVYPGEKARVAWSPAPAADGKYKIALAVRMSEPGSTDIFLVNLDGTGLVNLTSTFDDWESFPTWSPSADRLAVAVEDDVVVYDLGLVNGEVAITDSVNLTSEDDVPERTLNDGWIACPSWAKTEDKIAVMAPDSERLGDIWVIDLADPANPVNVTQTSDVEERGVSWSSDDASIVTRRAKYKKLKGGYYVVNVATGTQQWIGGDGSYADWKRE